MHSILQKFIRFYYKTGLKGPTRTTLALAKKFKSLQAVPVKIAGDKTLFADLRLLSAHGVFLGWTKDIEEESIIKKVLFPGETVFDIGAHIGLYSIFMSEIVGENGSLFAFELSPEALSALSQTVSLLDNVTLLPYGLSDKTETTFLYIPEDPSAASLSDWSGGESHKISCQIKRLDDLLAENIVAQPDFIKCDVEGAEELVFRGAEKTLNIENAPVIFFESNEPATVSFGLEKSGAMDFLKSLDKPEYKFYSVTKNGLHLIDEIPEPVSGDLAVNILAVPKSKLERVDHK